MLSLSKSTLVADPLVAQLLKDNAVISIWKEAMLLRMLLKKGI